MTTLRSYIPLDQQSATKDPTCFKKEQNQQEVRCGMCGKIGYVDEDTLLFVSEAIKVGLDNPFRCETCEEEYDDLAYEG